MEIFQTHKVEIRDEPFTLVNGKKLNQTVYVSLYNDHGNRIRLLKFARLDVQEVYEWIRDGKDLDFSQCYLWNFTLAEYRKLGDFSEQHVVKLESLNAENSFFDGDVEIDFSWAHFSTAVPNFKNAIFSGRQLTFYHTVFEDGTKEFSDTFFNVGEINFQYSDFNKGSINFKDSTFHSNNVSFVNSDFSDGKVYFTGCDFVNANVAFQFAKFGEGDISFEKVKFFGKKIDFSKVEFGDGKVDFRLTEFGDGDVLFDECEFGVGKLRFRRVKFGDGRISFDMAQLSYADINFERTEFGKGELSFYNAICGNVTFSTSHINCFVDFRFTQCDYLDLSNTIIRDIIDLTNDRGKVHIDCINFSGMRNLGRIFIDWHDNDVKSMIFKQKDSTVKMKAEQFRMLKEEFRALGQYNDEDKAYLEFKRLELKDRRQRAMAGNKLSALWIYPMYFSEFMIFDQIGHYATNPIRVLVSMLLSFISVTFLYIIAIYLELGDIVSSVGDPDKLPVVVKSFYHSAVTFLTIGYGDYYPSGIIRLISALEGFMGLFLMAYFTVAFVRKILR